MIYLNDALKKGYMINDTLDLSSRVMSLETAKEIMNKCTNVSGKTLSFSEDTWGLILSDDDAIEILEGIYSKGWNSNEPDIQIIAASGYNGKVNYNGSEQTLTQSSTNPNLWLKSNAGSITSLDCFSGMSSTDSSTYYNSTAVKIQKVRFGKNINTASCTTIRRMFRGASTSNIQFRKGDFRHLNTSSVTNMNAVFGEIETNGEIIDLIGLENWNTSNVTNFNFMFAGQTCTGTLDLHTWRVKSGATITSMFQYLDPMAARGCTPKFYYTPGYWSVDPMSDSNLAANVVKPVVYPYHDINVAAASGFNGQMYKDTALVNMTKDNTLGIWYYDFSSSYTFTTNSVRSLFRNNVNSTVTDNLYSVSFKKDAFSRADDASLDTYGMFMGCRALRSFDAEALSNKMTTGGYQMWNMGTASSSSLTTMHLPEFTQNYGYSATFQHCNSIRYAKFPTIKNASGYFASIFYGCTNLIRITNMPGIVNGANTTNAFTGCSALTTIDACGPISETIDMSAAPLSLASAKVVLAQLQTVTSETISFSDTTWGYILGDDEAIELLESAYNRGWNSNEPDIQITAASGYNGIVRVNAANKTLTQSTSNTELWYGSAGTVTALDFFLEHNNSSSAPAYNSTSTNIKKVRFGKNINTASCTTIRFAFGCASSNCTNLTKVDVRHINTANVTNMYGAFSNWNYLPLKEIVGLENFNTGKVTDFQNMFLSSYIKNKTIDLKGWHVLSSANLAAMFGTLSGYANMQISVCFFYTPGYWAKDPLTNISGAHCKPVVYPYHDITVAANSSYTGAAKVNANDVTLTKNATLGIWYYDIPSGTELTTLSNAFRNNITSISIRKGLNEGPNGVNLISFASTADSLYTVYFGIKKINTNIAWMFDYGNNGSALLNSFYGLDEAEAPNDTYIVDMVRGCPVLRFACLPKMSGTTSNSNQPFRGCTNLIWISNLPGIKQEDANFCYGCSSLTRISEASPIYETVSFSDSPLSLASAKVILRQLQTVVSETCTFSSTTYGYINNDTEARNLVTIAEGKGWNIPNTTPVPVVNPTFTTPTTSNATIRTFDAAATMTPGEGVSILRQGFCYNTSGTPTINDSITLVTPGSTSMSATIRYQKSHWYSGQDTTIRTEPDGSQWYHISHENNPASYSLSVNNWYDVSSQYVSSDKWLSTKYDRYINRHEYLVVQKQTSGGTTEKYRWVQSNSMCRCASNSVAVTPENIQVNTSSGYTAFPDKFGGLCALGYPSIYQQYYDEGPESSNNYLNTTYGRIFNYKRYNSGTNGFCGKLVTSGSIDLYVRIDNVSFQLKDNQRYYVRAFAELSNGTVVYSDNSSYITTTEMTLTSTSGATPVLDEHFLTSTHVTVSNHFTNNEDCYCTSVLYTYDIYTNRNLGNSGNVKRAGMLLKTQGYTSFSVSGTDGLSPNTYYTTKAFMLNEVGFSQSNGLRFSTLA